MVSHFDGANRQLLNEEQKSGRTQRSDRRYPHRQLMC